MAEYTAESIPQDSFKELIENNWVSRVETPTPDIFVVNDPEDARSRFDISKNDVITIRQGGPETLKYRGNIQYYDRAFPLIVEVWTRKDRQRLRDIWYQIKGIIFDHIFALSGYQIMRIKSYTEMVNDSLNIWKSEIRISAESAGECIETAGDYDRFAA